MCNKLYKQTFWVLLLSLVLASGCSAVKGQRYWWDDQTKEKLPNDYMLPESPPQYPVPTDPAPFVPKNLPDDEVQLATEEEKAQIKLGIPRSGVPDPLNNRVVVPAEEYVDVDEYIDEDEAELDYLEEGMAEEDQSFDEAVASDPGVMEFAEEEEALNDSGEAKDFIDEMSEDYNYNFDEEGPAGADYNYEDDPTPSNSVYEREEVVTDTQTNLENATDEVFPADPEFEGGIGTDNF